MCSRGVLKQPWNAFFLNDWFIRLPKSGLPMYLRKEDGLPGRSDTWLITMVRSFSSPIPGVVGPLPNGHSMAYKQG